MENKKFLDILFENRNKAYGAYELRITEYQSLMKAMFIGVGFLSLAMGGFVYSNKFDTIKYNKNVPVTFCEYIIDVNDEESPKKEEDQKVVTPPKDEVTQIKRAQADTNQIREIMPTPTDNPTNEETIKDRDELIGADLGANNRDGSEKSDRQIGGGDVSEGDKNVTGNQNNNTISAGTENKFPEIVKKPISTRDAKVMAIFPGCEKEASKGNDALTKCLSDKLSSELSNNMDDYAAIAERENKAQAVAKMNFIINKKGEITQVKPVNGSDASLGKEAKKALEKINKELIRKGKNIKPAKYDDGTDADLIFTIPVRFEQM